MPALAALSSAIAARVVGAHLPSPPARQRQVAQDFGSCFCSCPSLTFGIFAALVVRPGHRRQMLRASSRVEAAEPDAEGTRVAGKTVWFVRHGQAEHNVLFESGQVEACRALLDPELTDLGIQQAAAVADDVLLAPWLDLSGTGGGEGVELVVSSPLKRTVATALGAFGGWLCAARGRRVLLQADLQETGNVRCDTGSPLLELQKHFAKDAEFLDFMELQPGWEKKEGPYEDTGPALQARLGKFCDWIEGRPETRIAVVAHHNILAALLNVTFFNCEVRQYALNPIAGWQAVLPKVSQADSELSEAELRHLEVYDPMLRRKFARWGIEAPGRFR